MQEKNVKYTLTIICSDISCPANSKYNKLKDVFTPTTISHIPYEKLSYIIPDLVKQKFKENTFIEKDFKDILRLLADYFKIMFINDYNLDPTLAKINFNKKFHNMDLTEADINNMIKNKYKEACKINNNKIQNTEKLFKLYDNNGLLISKVIDLEDVNDSIKKIINLY